MLHGEAAHAQNVPRTAELACISQWLAAQSQPCIAIEMSKITQSVFIVKTYWERW